MMGPETRKGHLGGQLTFRHESHITIISRKISIPIASIMREVRFWQNLLKLVY